MCGRYVLSDFRLFLRQCPWILSSGVPDAGVVEAVQPRYNIAPTQEAPVVLQDRHDPEAGVVRVLRWGLVPSWAKDESIGSRLINARSETAAYKPAFRRAMKRRRCLVPANGFYEWQKPPEGGTRKIPHAIRLRDGGPMAFAGLWEVWRDPAAKDRPPLRTFTILTCRPNELVAPLHDRMPVVLPPEAWRVWLDSRRCDPAELHDLLRPLPANLMEAYPVSNRVNSVGNDDPSLLEPATAPPDTGSDTRREHPGLFD